MVIVPAVVCLAFGIELYFKAIIALENGSAKGHELSTLFSRLSPQSQAALRTRLSLGEVEFQQKLKAISVAFVEWRYIFEQQSANLDMAFLSDLARATKLLLESIDIFRNKLC